MNSIMTQQEIEEKLKEINEVNNDLLQDVAELFECVSVQYKNYKDVYKKLSDLRIEFANAEFEDMWECINEQIDWTKGVQERVEKLEERAKKQDERIDTLFARLSQVESLVGLTDEPKEKKLIITNRMPKKKRNKYRLHCGDEFESNKALAEYCETNPAVVSRWINVMGWVKKVKKA